MLVMLRLSRATLAIAVPHTCHTRPRILLVPAFTALGTCVISTNTASERNSYDAPPNNSGSSETTRCLACMRHRSVKAGDSVGRTSNGWAVWVVEDYYLHYVTPLRYVFMWVALLRFLQMYSRSVADMSRTNNIRSVSETT